MQFKSFMEALKGKQHKIDKNKNGEIDAQDFKLLRKEESELNEVSDEAKNLANAIASKHKNMKVSVERGNVMIHHKDDDEKIDRLTLSHTGNNRFHLHRTGSSTEDESHRNLTADEVHKHAARHIGGLHEAEVRMARADYKVGPSGRKSHKEIVFNDAESKDDKEEMKEAKMSDADMAERERIVKGMKKNLAGFKARYGDDAKSVMYATATKQAMKEEAEELDEKSDQAKRNKIMKNVMAASKGAQINRGLKLDPAEYGYKRAQNLNVAIGRAAMKAEEVKKDDVPFDGPYTKTKPAKNSDGTTQLPMSRARQLAKDAMKKQMKEDIDRLFEKDEQEYGYEGDMAMNQLATLTRCAEMIKDTLKPDTDLPEWVQSKITLATDYIVTAADYLHSELEEGYYEKPASAYRRKGDEIGGGSHAPVAPVPDRKYIKGTPEHKAYKATKKPINGMPTNVKESFDADGNIINSKVSYKEFAMMLEYEAKDGRYVHKGSYGGNYVDPEGADDADDKKVKQQPADKRGRGRPAGAKSGARKITGTSKLFK
jgi:hypothetical protein